MAPLPPHRVAIMQDIPCIAQEIALGGDAA
jgi:hypothetical protein